MSKLQRLLLAVMLLGLTLAQRDTATAQTYQFSGPFLPHTGGPPPGCNMTGVADLTNTCNNIYLLTGVFK